MECINPIGSVAWLWLCAVVTLPTLETLPTIINLADRVTNRENVQQS